jgi:hypothetical protein
MRRRESPRVPSQNPGARPHLWMRSGMTLGRRQDLGVLGRSDFRVRLVRAPGCPGDHCRRNHLAHQRRRIRIPHCLAYGLQHHHRRRKHRCRLRPLDPGRSRTINWRGIQMRSGSPRTMARGKVCSRSFRWRPPCCVIAESVGDLGPLASMPARSVSGTGHEDAPPDWMAADSYIDSGGFRPASIVCAGSFALAGSYQSTVGPGDDS